MTYDQQGNLYTPPVSLNADGTVRVSQSLRHENYDDVEKWIYGPIKTVNLPKCSWCNLTYASVVFLLVVIGLRVAYEVFPNG